MKKVILIGGAPGTGKSTLAKNIAKHLDLPWISTDQIRGIIRDYASRERYPDLLLPEGFDTAEKFLNNFSAQEIAEMEYRQSYDVWPAIKYLIEENSSWEKGVIIEGVNIIPELIAENTIEHSNVQAIFIIDEDYDRLRDVVYGRGIWDRADSYTDDLKPKEIEWVTLYTGLIKASAEKYGYPILKVEKNENDFTKALLILKDKLEI